MFTTFNLWEGVGVAPPRVGSNFRGFQMMRCVRFVGLFAAVVAVFVAPGVAHAESVSAIKFTPQTAPGAFDYGAVDGVGGKTKTQVFTLRNSGGRATSALKI